MAAGVTAGLGQFALWRDNFLVGTDQNDLPLGTVVVRHSTETDAIQISSTTTPQLQQFLAVLHEPEGSTAATSTTDLSGPDSHPKGILLGRNIPCLIEDNATPVLNARLTLSGTTAGTFVTAASTERVWAICKRAITSGGVGLTTPCDIIGAGVPEP